MKHFLRMERAIPQTKQRTGNRSRCRNSHSAMNSGRCDSGWPSRNSVLHGTCLVMVMLGIVFHYGNTPLKEHAVMAFHTSTMIHRRPYQSSGGGQKATQLVVSSFPFSRSLSTITSINSFRHSEDDGLDYFDDDQQQQQQQQHRHNTNNQDSARGFHDNSSDDADDVKNNLERARQHFERVWQQSRVAEKKEQLQLHQQATMSQSLPASSSSSSYLSDHDHCDATTVEDNEPFPVMTTIARQRMELEIQLLQQLYPSSSTSSSSSSSIHGEHPNHNNHDLMDRSTQHHDSIGNHNADSHDTDPDVEVIDRLADLWMTEGGSIIMSSTCDDDDDDDDNEVDTQDNRHNYHSTDVPDAVATYVQLLHDMEHGCSSGLRREEPLLRQLAQEYPFWADVYVRWALVLYYQGRTAEAYMAIRHAIWVKPWHFEAYHVLVQLSLRPDSRHTSGSSKYDIIADVDTPTPLVEVNHLPALRWARRGLPRRRNSRRRVQWVNWAIALAKERYESMDHATHEYYSRRRNDSGGIYYANSHSSSATAPTTVSSSDSWQ
jgi:hypothetical protein